jgi:hypothetical protein
MWGRIPVKEQQSRTNAIWTSWCPRGANLVYSHSWRRRTLRSYGFMVCFGLGRTPTLWSARRRVLMYWPAVGDDNA